MDNFGSSQNIYLCTKYQILRFLTLIIFFMTKFYKSLLTLLLALCTTVANAYDFKVDNIYYNITDAENKTVEVTKGADSRYNYYGDVVIPDYVTYEGTTYKVTRIGEMAFCYDKYMESITIGKEIRSVSKNAFSSSCENLTKVHISDLSAWCQIDFEDASSPVAAKSQCNLYLNGEILVDLVIPEDITEIKNETFNGCGALQSVTLHDKITSIGQSAFQSCTSLKNIQLLNGLKSIGREAFSGCGLTSIEIPSSVTEIGVQAFWANNKLTTVTSNILAANLFNCYGWPQQTDEMTLIVPAGSKSVYATTEGWNNIANIEEMEYDHTVNVSDAGYATLYLGCAAEIPNGVEVYTANAVEGNLLKMQPVEGTIPANTGVIVKAPKGSYNFHCLTTDVPAIAKSMFKGSIVNKNVSVPSGATAFVLSKVNGEVGMYPAQLTDNAFLNNANKAYLMLGGKDLGVYDDEELDTSVGGSQLSLRFDFGGTTAIEKLPTEVAAESVIFDLSGRKVEQVTVPGIYLVNNKKVYIK